MCRTIARVERKKLLELHGFTWSVVESVPVHESIKLGKAEREQYIQAYKQTVRNLGKCGVHRICYNFMPVLDWTRTDLTRRWPDGSEALAYDADDLAAFDLFILKRDGAEKEYEAAAFSRAKAIFEKMTEKEKETLQQNIIAGLPGRMVEAYTVQEFRQAVAQYKDVSPAQIRENLAYFLKSIIPVCEEAGVYMAIHPDDPPRPILGLPPACSTRDDVAALLKAADSKHNGITLCVGTYASSPQNKVEEMAKEFASPACGATSVLAMSIRQTEFMQLLPRSEIELGGWKMLDTGERWHYVFVFPMETADPKDAEYWDSLMPNPFDTWDRTLDNLEVINEIGKEEEFPAMLEKFAYSKYKCPTDWAEGAASFELKSILPQISNLKA
eukprot:g11787.t1